MIWKNHFEALVKTAGEILDTKTDELKDKLIESLRPVIEAKLLELAAKLSDEVHSRARVVGIEVKRFFEKTAKPSVLEILKNDACFGFLSECVYECLPRPVQRRVRIKHIIKFCFDQRQRLIALLEGKPTQGPQDSKPDVEGDRQF